MKHTVRRWWPRRRQTLSPCAREPHSPSMLRRCLMTSESVCQRIYPLSYWKSALTFHTAVDPLILKFAHIVNSMGFHYCSDHHCDVICKGIVQPDQSTSCSLTNKNLHYPFNADNWLFNFCLFFLKDPKGDWSWMLSLWLSSCSQERVWQESSEWHFLITFLISLPYCTPPAPQDTVV